MRTGNSLVCNLERWYKSSFFFPLFLLHASPVPWVSFPLYLAEMGHITSSLSCSSSRLNILHNFRASKCLDWPFPSAWNYRTVLPNCEMFGQVLSKSTGKFRENFELQNAPEIVLFSKTGERKAVAGKQSKRRVSGLPLWFHYRHLLCFNWSNLFL